MQSLIDISNIDRNLLLKKLWENSTNKYNIKQLNFDLSIAMKQIMITGYPDYICGRPIKVDIYKDELVDPYLYDRENGNGKFQEVVNTIIIKNNYNYIPKGVSLEQCNIFHTS